MPAGDRARKETGHSPAQHVSARRVNQITEAAAQIYMYMLQEPMGATDMENRSAVASSSISARQLRAVEAMAGDKVL